MEVMQLTKKCSQCGENIIFATRRGLERAIAENRMCYWCRGKAKRGTLGRIFVPKQHKRKCPDCGGEIIYKSKAAHDYGKLHNLKCKKCKGRHCKECGAKVQWKNQTGHCITCYQNIYLPAVRIADSYDVNSWKRPCPQCKREISYTTRCGFALGKAKNSLCRDCASPKRIRKYCTICKTVELSSENTSGMCGPCYTNHLRSRPKLDIQYTCPDCKQTTIYPYNNRRGKQIKRENLPCIECRRKARSNKPLLSDYACIICKSSFTIDRRTQNPRLTCSYKCYLAHRHSINTYTTAEFIERAKKVHGDTWYEYSKSNYTGVLDKIIITCRKHGDFKQFPQDHLNGSGCPKCNASHGETRIRVWLEQNNINYEYQKCFPDCINPKTGGKLRYDFYVPDYSLLIEYDGMQHYQFMPADKWQWTRVTSVESLESVQERDNLKDQYAKDKGFELLRINFMQKHITEKILTDAFQKLPCKSKNHTLYHSICHGVGTF